jgi:transcriptional regulator with XRE-family HTH domain
MAAAKTSAATKSRTFRTFLLMQQFQAREIGARIAQARREADGMTQETLADLIGVSKRSIQDYESGATIPWKKMREIARVLDKEVDWFMRGSPEPPDDGGSDPVKPSDLVRLEERVAALQKDLSLVLEMLRGIPGDGAGHGQHQSETH